MRLGIIDYGAGNLQSVANAVHSLGYAPHLLSSPDDFDQITHLILPGVGSFGDSMLELGRRRLVEPIVDWIAEDRPFFGICVGYQMLFESGDESPGTPGIGVFKGTVRRFDEEGRKIPHMGWNAARPTLMDDPLWKTLGHDPYFYFVHSYYPVVTDQSLTAMVTDYQGIRFVSAVRRGQLIATQFHPEKSQHAGLALLSNFLKHPVS